MNGPSGGPVPDARPAGSVRGRAPRHRRFIVGILPLVFPVAAAAVEFGRLELRSVLGEPLRAEVQLHPQAGDTLAAGCLRLVSPARRDLAPIDGAQLELRSANAASVLGIVTTRPLDEPLAVIAIEADCGGGRSVSELPVLLKPAKPTKAARSADGGEWVVLPGESPASLARLLYPGQAATQRRFVAALAKANPVAGIDVAAAERPLAAGMHLRVPDWRAVGGGAEGVAGRPPAEVPGRPAGGAAAGGGFLQMAGDLSPSPLADEATRDVLRREYRLLELLQGQLTATALSPAAEPPTQKAAATDRTPASPATDVVPPAAAAAPPPSATDAPASPAPLAQPVAPAPAVPAAPAAPAAPLPTAAAAAGAVYDLLPWLGAAALLILVLLLVLRRRRAPPPVSLEDAETMVLERPQPAADVPTLDDEAVAAPPAAKPEIALPEVPEEKDANPVMELAEIMLSFGRLQGAAQTLQEYIEANPREALLPWMKLLDIYREGGMRADFETLAGKLHANFNVEVQQWDGRPPPLPIDAVPRALQLEELPHICERIVACWGTQECFDYLHQLLRDNRGGERIGFTLPVVQEILLLIDVLANRETTEKP